MNAGALLILLAASASARTPADFHTVVFAARSEIKLALSAFGEEYRLVWDGRRFECKDISGRRGYNSVSAQEIQSTGKGECADLRGINLRNARFRSADLRGADLRGASVKGAERL
jgi:hypothetical protein